MFEAKNDNYFNIYTLEMSCCRQNIAGMTSMDLRCLANITYNNF